MTEISLKILDMECAACVARLDRVISRLHGVKSAQVNFTASSASITSFKTLNKKELIQKELQEWIDTNNPELYYDPEFYNFTTYFTGYNENRMNMYSDESKATAVAYRLIDENLPKFIDNIRIFEKIKNSGIAEHFPEICRDMEPWLNFASLDELFSLEAYNSVLTQAQIDAYNTIIGGIKDEQTKLKGLNEYINLFNQKSCDCKLPKFKMLYKQILSDRVSASWLPESFENAQELLDAVDSFSQDCVNGLLLNSIRNVLVDLPAANLEHIYIRNDASVSAISNRLFGYYGVFNDALCIDPENKKKADYYSVAALQTALDEYVKALDAEDRVKQLSAYSGDCIAAYFKSCIAEYLDAIHTSHEAVKDILGVAHA